MGEPRAAPSSLPPVAWSGRLVRAGDTRRGILLALLMVLVWLAGFALWIAVWRYGRWLGGFAGHAVSTFAFCAGAFHTVSLGVIRDRLDRTFCRHGR